MNRITAWDNGNAYYPKCFEEPCDGMGCSNERCGFKYEKCKRLAEYEDTGLTPEGIISLNTFDGSQGVKATIKLQEERRKHSWTPVSERLPEHDGLYLACFDDEFITAVTYVSDRHGVQDWELWADSGDVVAWMPLTEPYKG